MLQITVTQLRGNGGIDRQNNECLSIVQFIVHVFDCNILQQIIAGK